MVLKNLLLKGTYLVMTICLLSCATPKELEYRDFKNFTVDQMGFSASTVSMDLIYYNPNNFGLQLRSADLDVFLDNNYLGHTVQEQLVSIPKQEEFSVPIKMDVDMKNLIKNGLLSLVSKEVVVKVTGTVKVGKGRIFKTFPVSYEGKHTLSF